jgi:hypothetical protein
MGSGLVGINTSAPSYELDVKGKGRFTSTLTCQTLIQTSQTSLKDNIKEITKTKAKTIAFKEYNYKSDTGNRKRYGVLAEDIEREYPELVHVGPDGTKGVSYIDLLIKRVAELEKELEDITLTQGPKGNTGSTGLTGSAGPKGSDGNSHLGNVNSIAINSKTGNLEVGIGKMVYKFNAVR